MAIYYAFRRTETLSGGIEKLKDITWYANKPAADLRVMISYYDSYPMGQHVADIFQDMLNKSMHDNLESGVRYTIKIVSFNG